MTTLHLLNHCRLNNNDDDGLLQQLKNIGSSDTLLLLEDGVYLTEFLSENLQCHIAVLKKDVDTRGLTLMCITPESQIDYPKFVQLACDHQRSISW